METRFIYLTCKDKQEALEIGKGLLKEKLIACANVIDGVLSLYKWEGKLQEDSETILVAKSQASSVDKLIAYVQRVHSYEVPCVVSLPILEGNPAYLNWIESEMS